MTGMIAQLLAWPTLGVALLAFGFAPGVVLRLIVLFYRRGNPRRQELLAELYAVPRIERPFWVAEQLEVALFEGLRDRLTLRRDRRIRRLDNLSDQLDELEQLIKRAKLKSISETLGQVNVQLAASDDLFASSVAEDVARGWRSRGWRGRGWRGAQPETPPTNDHDPPAGV
jgi:hypothetical protein